MATPLAQEGAGHGRVRREDCHRDGALAGGRVLGAFRDDVVAIQPLVLDPLIAQELRQPLGRRDGAAFAAWNNFEQ